MPGTAAPVQAPPPASARRVAPASAPESAGVPATAPEDDLGF
jgi:hypothetical protein